MAGFHRQSFRGLGQVSVAAQLAPKFGYLVASVLAGAGASVIGEMLGGPDTQDSWLDRSVFNDRMRAMHSGFLMIQCEVGGSQAAYGCDDAGRNCLCPENTRPKCTLPAGKLREWRALRDGFSRFYNEVGGSDWFDSDWLVLDPTNAQVMQARDYAKKLVRFFVELPLVCPNYQLPFDLSRIVAADVGTTAQQTAVLAAKKAADEPAWVRGMRYGAIGLGVVGVLWVASTLRDVFRKR